MHFGLFCILFWRSPTFNLFCLNIRQRIFSFDQSKFNKPNQGPLTCDYNKRLTTFTVITISCFYCTYAVLMLPDIKQVFVNIFVQQILRNFCQSVGLQIEVLQLAQTVQRCFADHLQLVVVQGQPQQLLQRLECLQRRSKHCNCKFWNPRIEI